MYTINYHMFDTVNNGVKKSRYLQEMAGHPGYYRPSSAMALLRAPLILDKRFDPFSKNLDMHILFC